MIRVVIIESPFAAPTPEGVARNRRYLDACILDCIRRGETPYASHKMLTDALDDANPEEWEAGIQAGFLMREALACVDPMTGFIAQTAVYVDLGIPDGMRRGIEHCRTVGESVEGVPNGMFFEYRKLGGEWAP